MDHNGSYDNYNARPWLGGELTGTIKRVFELPGHFFISSVLLEESDDS